MLVGGADDSEFMSLFQAVEDRPFPVPRTHIVQIGVVSHIPLGEPVARIHLHERSLLPLAEILPVVASVACLVAHMVRGDEYFLSPELFLPILDGAALDQRSVQSLVQGHVVAVDQAVSLITDESEELAGTVVLPGHRPVFLIASLSKPPEGVSVIAYHPFEAGLVAQKFNVRPHRVRSDAHEVQLLCGGLESVPHISVTVCDVAVVVQVAPVQFQASCFRDSLSSRGRGAAGLKQTPRGRQSHKRPSRCL